MKRLSWLLLLPLASGALFAQVLYTITGTVPTTGTVGVFYSSGSLTVSPGSPQATWSISAGLLPPGLNLIPASGTSTAISGTPTTAGSYSFTVQATIGGITNGVTYVRQPYTVTIGTPAFTVVSASLPNGVVGVNYSQGVTAAGGYGPQTYTFTLIQGSLPPGLQLNSASGVIYGIPTTAGPYYFILQVTSQLGTYPVLTAPGTFSINITPPPLTITTSSLPAGTVGVAYSQALTATGGTPPYTWQVTGGTLPPGLTLTSSGNVSGTPTAASSFTFQVKVSDSQQGSASGSFTIRINPAALVITTTSLPAGTVGTSYTATPLAATGGVPPYQWSVSAGTAPTGLTLNASTGSLTGTPTAAGTFNFTVQVADSAKATATKAFTIAVAGALTIPPATLSNGTVGTPYSQTLTATGGTAPFTWSVSTGTLPAGLTLSATGSLTGAPTAAGTFNFTIQVVDSAGRSATATFTITVIAALSITTASPLPNATVGSSYSQTLTATGGTAPFTWSVSTGTLPGGITLSSAGSLSGTPSAPGTFTFTVGVTGGGQSATRSFTITVGVPPGPPATFTGLPATATPATQPALGIGIPSAYPLDITGQVTLTFAPDSPSPDGQEVVFTTGGRIVSFQVPANTTQVVFSGATPGVQTGTVSGIITLTLKLTAAGIDITPSPAPSTTLLIAKSAPKITSATITRTSGGFNLVVVGYATSREMVSANVTFTAAAGVTLSSSQATVSLATVFTTWYQSSASAAYGSQFSLTMPFTFTNATSTAPLASVAVVLTNTQGSSTTVSAAY